MIRFLDLGAAYQELREQIDAAVLTVLGSGRYIGGSAVSQFEEKFAAYVGAKHCIGVGNGMDALMLALRACGIGPGDGVIVPSHTYIASWLAVSMIGATVQTVEPSDSDMLIDVARIEAAITPATRAIMPVHLYGQACDMATINDIARKHGLYVIEDAAQAHGACFNGNRIGTAGDLVCWSFYPGKNLGALGDGGAITTNDAALAKRVMMLGNYGSEEKYVHNIMGTNSRLDPVQAAVLEVKLKHLNDWNDRRRSIAGRYTEMLQNITNAGIRLPYTPDHSTPVWHLYVLRCDDRAAVAEHLKLRGIETLIHYPQAIHAQKAYGHLGITDSDLPIATAIAQQALSIPIGPHLSSAGASEVIHALQEFPANKQV